jgi:hypothetical protein
MWADLYWVENAGLAGNLREGGIDNEKQESQWEGREGKGRGVGVRSVVSGLPRILPELGFAGRGGAGNAVWAVGANREISQNRGLG